METATVGNDKTGNALLATQNEAFIKDKTKERDDTVWLADARGKILSMSTSDGDILEFMMKTLNDPNVSDARRQAVQYLTSLRVQTVTLMSNILRQIFDGTTAVIRNIRS